MANVAVLAMRWGQKAAEPVSEKFEGFYTFVSNWFVESPTVINNGPRLTTFAFTGEGDFAHASKAISEYLQLSDPAIAIVDLTNSTRVMLAPYSVVSGIVECARTASSSLGHTIRLVFLLPAEMWDHDPPMELIRPLIDTGDAWILTDRGALIGGDPLSGRQLKPEMYVRALESARSAPLWLLRQKVIRRYGHYKRTRPGKPYSCVSFFFDGSSCTKELTHLFTDRLSEKGVTEIFVEHGDSDWILDAVEVAAENLSLPCKEIESGSPLRAGVAVSGRPAIILAMCDSGSTIASILRTLKERNPEADPYIISVLSTQGKADESGKRVLVVDDSQYILEYLLRVEQRHYPATECRQCRVGIAFDDPQTEPDSPGEISPNSMWSMIFESGLKPEQDVPASRPSLGLVPNFPDIVRRNGPFLATRMNSILDNMDGKLSRNPIVVCPNEIGAEALTDALTSLFPYTVIRIPRPDIEKFGAGQLERSDSTDWEIQLGSLGRRADETKVIVLDEFNASGGTRATLAELVLSFGVGVRCYFSLFDFAPAAKANLEAPAFSIYSIDWINRGDRGQ